MTTSEKIPAALFIAVYGEQRKPEPRRQPDRRQPVRPGETFVEWRRRLHDRSGEAYTPEAGTGEV